MTHSSLATAQTSEAAVVGRTGGNYCSDPTAQSYNQGSLTHRLHAHELQRGSAASSRSGSQAAVPAPPCPALGGHRSSGGPAKGSALEVAQPGLLPRVPLHVVLVQWAAKVAFFKVKLDQLMDSLCRVCLAESKQNLLKYSTSLSVSSISTLSRSISLGRKTSSAKRKRRGTSSHNGSHATRKSQSLELCNLNSSQTVKNSSKWSKGQRREDLCACEHPGPLICLLSKANAASSR